MTEAQRKSYKLSVWSFVLASAGFLFMLTTRITNLSTGYEIPIIIVSSLLCFPAFFMGNRAIRQIKLNQMSKGADLADLATWFSGWSIVYILFVLYFILAY